MLGRLGSRIVGQRYLSSTGSHKLSGAAGQGSHEHGKRCFQPRAISLRRGLLPLSRLVSSNLLGRQNLVQLGAPSLI